jgi:hypothetical protein
MVTLHGIIVKFGDKVWDFRNGWDEIIGLHSDLEHQIETNYRRYTSDGKLCPSNKFPSLFWNEFEIPKEAFRKPLPKIEVGTKVLVWNDDDSIKERRYFSHFNSVGNIYCFSYGATEWSTKNDQMTSWNNWELYERTK